MAEVLVLVEHADGALKKVSTELITAARVLGEPAAVVVPQTPDTPVEVEMPPVIKPVDIDALMQPIEQMNDAQEEPRTEEEAPAQEEKP